MIGPVLVALLGVGAGVRSHHEWTAVAVADEGAWRGWAVVVGDAAPAGRGTRVTLAIDGRRHDVWAYGPAARKAATLSGGDRVWLEGTRSAIVDPSSRRRAAVRHVVGRCSVSLFGDVRDGPIVAVAANRVRAMLRDAAATAMEPPTAALFTGLVIGDDARQDPTTVDEFRRAGLSHLTAVSGQNVAFVLLAAGPVLRRLRPLARWGATVGLIGGFVVATRGEPSVLRAASMAALGVTAFAVGRPVHPVRLLSLAVTGLVLVDPFLVWSVAFWLSVAATAGVCVIGPLIESRLPGPSWWRAPMSLTLGAQVGVALPSLLVFGRLPIVAVAANPAAAPVAGWVMLAGLPTAAVAGMASVVGLPALGRLVMWPMDVGTRWVAVVARVSSAIEPPLGWSLAGWVVVAAAVASRRPRTGVPI